MKDIIQDIQRYAGIARSNAPLRLVRRKRRQIRRWKAKQQDYIRHSPSKLLLNLDPDEIQIEATITIFEFESLTGQTAPYMLREMEMTQAYRKHGYNNLREWAYAELAHVKPLDTLSRMCGATLTMIAELDRKPMITDQGEKIDGLALIAQAAPSAIEKLYGMFGDKENGERDQLVAGLLTGSSDASKIKQSVGWEPKIGKATAIFEEISEELTRITIDCTYAQSKAIEKSIQWVCKIQFTRRGQV